MRIYIIRDLQNRNNKVEEVEAGERRTETGDWRPESGERRFVPNVNITVPILCA